MVMNKRMLKIVAIQGKRSEHESENTTGAIKEAQKEKHIKVEKKNDVVKFPLAETIIKATRNKQLKPSIFPHCYLRCGEC